MIFYKKESKVGGAYYKHKPLATGQKQLGLRTPSASCLVMVGAVERFEGGDLENPKLIP